MGKNKRLFRKTAAIMAVLMMCASVSRYPAYATTNATGGESVIGKSVVIGRMLELDVIAPQDDDTGIQNLINNGGMSGLEAANHMHGTDYRQMYSKTVADGVFGRVENGIVFDIGHVESVGPMYIWNYNAPDLLNCGLKDVLISYSEDGESWRNLGTGEYTFAMCKQEENDEHGGNMASNLDDGLNTPVDFQGRSLRYIRIIPLSNWGGESYGLSEVRVFKHKQRPNGNAMINIESFCPTDTGKVTFGENLANNSGMSGLGDKDDVHGNDPRHMWKSEGSSRDSLIILNLDGTYPVSEIRIWNYNDPSNLQAGVKEIKVEYTTQEAASVSTKQGIDFSKGRYTELGVFDVPAATGAENEEASLIIPVDNIQMQHIRLTPVSNHGGNGFGLSEVRVYAGNGVAVEPSRNWTGLFNSSGTFAYQGYSKSNTAGFILADGLHAINMADGAAAQQQGSADAETKTLFTMQDTFRGNFGNYSKFDEVLGYDIKNMGMVNHSYMYLEGGEPDPRNAKFIVADHYNRKDNLYPGHYWLGDTAYIDGAAYNLANHVEGAGSLGLDYVDYYEHVIDPETGFPSLKTPPVLVGGKVDAMFELSRNRYHFDTIMEEVIDGIEYIYTFGRNKDKKIVAARATREDFKTYSNLEYWNGDDWVKDKEVVSTRGAVLSGYGSGNEFSVTHLGAGVFGDKYINVYMEGSSISGQIAYAVTDEITDGFYDRQEIYWVDDRYKVPMEKYPNYEYDGNILFDQWLYNAKAQPAISKEGELLITYHTGYMNIPTVGYFFTTGAEYMHPTFLCMYELSGEKVEIVTVSDTSFVVPEVPGVAESTAAPEADVTETPESAEENGENTSQTDTSQIDKSQINDNENGKDDNESDKKGGFPEWGFLVVGGVIGGLVSGFFYWRKRKIKS